MLSLAACRDFVQWKMSVKPGLVFAGNQGISFPYLAVTDYWAVLWNNYFSFFAGVH